MIELEDGFSENDKYLIREYEKHGTDDFLLTEIGDKTFVVPYKYTIGSNTARTSIGRFKAALVDFEGIEAAKYRKAGEKPRLITHDGEAYVVPFSVKGDVSPEKLADYYAKKAAAKYNAIINSARQLEAFGEAPDMTDMSTFSANKYAERLNILGTTAVLDEQTPERLEIMDFLHKYGDKALKNFKITSDKLAKGVARKIVEAEQKVAEIHVPTKYKVAALAGLITVGAGTAFVKNIDKNNQQTEVTQNGFYTDFSGETHADPYGNIAKINEMRADITAMMLAVEGYSQKAFPDGGGVPTIGIGTTFYLTDEGKEVKVKMGDTITKEEAFAQKWRYIEKKMFPLLAETVGRECSKEELKACIGAGFCWGVNGFRKSQFFKSVKKNEPVHEQIRKLTGFRKQKGLLKRSYVLANVLNGTWTTQDMLQIPILKYKGAYLNCGIYPLNLRDLMPCRTDKNGNYLKDKLGNDIPKVEKDNFCKMFYVEQADSVMNKMINHAEKMLHRKENSVDYVMVRDLMPEDALNEILSRDVFTQTANKVYSKTDTAKILALNTASHKGR